jgi:hypothetical protein
LHSYWLNVGCDEEYGGETAMNFSNGIPKGANRQREFSYKFFEVFNALCDGKLIQKRR